MGIAANKSDLIEKEQVNEAEARKYAKEQGAIFKLTSACTAVGIEELFKSIGCKVLNPNFSEDDDSPTTGAKTQIPVQKHPQKEKNITLKSNDIGRKEGKKCC